MIYIVLGMHKSGTSLVAEILHHSGINMVESVDASISYDQGNKYERKSTQVLNRKILGAKPFVDGFSSLDLPAPDTLRVTEDLRAKIREFIQNCNEAYDDWGFKDPRTCLTYPVWASELPEHRIIAIYRSPSETWPRFRSFRRFLTNPFRAWKYINRWFEHNTNILAYLENCQVDFLILSYRELMMTQTEFDRLQEFIGSKLEDRRVPSLYRNRPKEYPLLKIAEWLAFKRTGCTPEKIIEQLETLRRK
jgi:hypothetical protein